MQQNGALSNAVTFTVPGGGLTLEPNILNMGVGDTHTIQALSTAGQPVTGLTWASSDSTIVSLSTDDPPILTALAPGHITITAGGASADVIVYAGALPLGTVIWSNPGIGGNVTSIIPAVPSPTGVADVFAVQATDIFTPTIVQAITADGVTAWTATLSPQATITPDFQGGLVAFEPSLNSISKLDGLTGQPGRAYSPGPLGTPGAVALDGHVVVHTDGTIFTVQGNDQSGTQVVAIDSTTGAGKFSVLLGELPINNPIDSGLNCGTGAVFGRAQVRSLIVAGDGNAYVGYDYPELIVSCPGPDIYISHLRVMRVDTSGGASVVFQKDLVAPTSSGGVNPEGEVVALPMISNADRGVLLSWSLFWIGDSYSPPPIQFGMAITTGASASEMNAPSVPDQSSAVIPVLQLQDGSFVGTVGQSNGQQNMIAFDQSGSVRWSVPNEQPQIATEDGGVIGQSGTIYDQNGNATGQINPPTYSWLGNSYRIGSVEQTVTNIINLAASWWPFAGGNASGNGTANMPATKAIRDLIAQRANFYASINSTAWPDIAGNNKCNLFVKQVLDEAGARAPVSLGTRIRFYFGRVDGPTYPASAGDWAFPHNTLACWHVVLADLDTLGPDYPSDHTEPGDVIAEAINYLDASGHVGIVVGPKQTASADSAAPCFPPYLTPPGVIDISDFGFRALDWVDPYRQPNGQPCRASGIKSNAVVKRFVCQ